MRHLLSLILALLSSVPVPALAQVANMPQYVQDLLEEVGPRWGTDLDTNIRRTLDAYTPILRGCPKAGVSVTADLSYGPDTRHKLDIFRREGQTGVSVVVFLHGGAYVRGDRNINAEVYGNVATYFARQGMLAVNATYRFAIYLN